MTLSSATTGLAAAILAAQPLIGLQQPSNPRAGFPCEARLDPSYFRLAEATGGQMLLVAPDEIADSAPLLVTPDDHRHTIFRLAGLINPGVHEFRVPIDSSVESAMFSIAVQCLETGDVIRPSGARLVAGEGVTVYSNFRAQRMMIVKQPEPGMWTVRASGKGLGGVMVQARTDVGITSVEFAATGSTAFTSEPIPSVENLLAIGISGGARDVRAALVTAEGRRIADLTLTAGQIEGSYTSRFTPGTEDFRVMIEGKNADGTPFQRVLAGLFSMKR